MIGLIAHAHLTPAASAAVIQLLQENPIDPALNRFCKDRPSDLMADSATWADDMRSAGKPGEWHYIDIPLAVADGDWKEWCKPAGVKDAPDCLPEAAARYLGILQDKTQPAASRAEALRYTIHFFSDMTQPLHTEDNHDQGGNCDPVTVPYQERTVNLHSLWDSGLLGDEMKRTQLTEAQFAAAIDTEAGFDAHRQQGVDITSWVWESHKLARDVVYGNLTPQIPVAPSSAGAADKDACDADRAKITALHVTIGQQYTDAALPVMHAQIARAAYRIADVLNQTFQ